MVDIVGTIFVILVIFFGVPLVIVRLRDRVGVTGTIVKRVMGTISLLFGVIISGWIVYNVFSPTQEFQASYKTFFQLSVPIALTCAGWKWLTDTGPGIEEQNIDFDAPELVAAQQHAQELLPEFVEQVKRQTKNALIKFPLRTDSNVIEHIWAQVLGYTDGVFSVSLANVPRTQAGSYENEHDVPEIEIEDWQILLPDGRIKGAYSYIGAFQYLENRGVKLNKTMRKQKSQLIDATDNKVRCA